MSSKTSLSKKYEEESSTYVSLKKYYLFLSNNISKRPCLPELSQIMFLRGYVYLMYL